MKRIVAAPTAGACGVLPAVLVTYYKEYNVPEEKMIEAMYVAAGLGQIIANRAYLGRGIRRVPGRDWFRIGDGGPEQSVTSKVEMLSDWTCLCDGTEESDGACM